jgi:hypothetical protein
MYQNFIIPCLNEAQHVSGDTPPIIRSLKLHKQPLVLHMWKVVGHAGLTTFHVCKTRGCLCSFRLLMMGSVSPETCWASFKRTNKILICCCFLLVFLCKYCAMMHGSTNVKEAICLWFLMVIFCTFHLFQLYNPLVYVNMVICFDMYVSVKGCWFDA